MKGRVGDGRLAASSDDGGGRSAKGNPGRRAGVSCDRTSFRTSRCPALPVLSKVADFLLSDFQWRFRTSKTLEYLSRPENGTVKTPTIVSGSIQYNPRRLARVMNFHTRPCQNPMESHSVSRCLENERNQVNVARNSREWISSVGL